MELPRFPSGGVPDVTRLEPGTPSPWPNSSDDDDDSRFANDEESTTARLMRWNMLWLLTVIVATGGGNLLVCAAVCRERALQNMANYFLVFLATRTECNQ